MPSNRHLQLHIPSAARRNASALARRFVEAFLHRRQDYADELNVAVLAAEANMSVPAFHANFKAVTQCSPIQYVKSARLHQARLLMIRNDMTASAACAQVGYESQSQFSREFKRLFGRSPGEEANFMKHSLALMPAAHDRECVTAH